MLLYCCVYIWFDLFIFKGILVLSLNIQTSIDLHVMFWCQNIQLIQLLKYLGKFFHLWLIKFNIFEVYSHWYETFCLATLVSKPESFRIYNFNHILWIMLTDIGHSLEHSAYICTSPKLKSPIYPPPPPPNYLSTFSQS